MPPQAVYRSPLRSAPAWVRAAVGLGFDTRAAPATHPGRGRSRTSPHPAARALRVSRSVGPAAGGDTRAAPEPAARSGRPSPRRRRCIGPVGRTRADRPWLRYAGSPATHPRPRAESHVSSPRGPRSAGVSAARRCIETRSDRPSPGYGSRSALASIRGLRRYSPAARMGAGGGRPWLRYALRATHPRPDGCGWWSALASIRASRYSPCVDY